VKKLLIVWVLILGTWAFSQGPDERIILSFTINGKPTQLALDTGANAPVLYRKAAERLGVRITNAPPALKASSGHLILPLTELVDLGAFKTQFGVYDQLPGSLAQEDGILPWQSIRNQALTINAEALDVGQPALMEPPPHFKGWTKLTIATNTPFLELEITGEGEPGRILIDTGYPYGVAISRKKWSKWRAAHPAAPSTPETGRFPSTGPFVAQEAWAEENCGDGVCLALSESLARLARGEATRR